MAPPCPRISPVPLSTTRPRLSSPSFVRFIFLISLSSGTLGFVRYIGIPRFSFTATACRSSVIFTPRFCRFNDTTLAEQRQNIKPLLSLLRLNLSLQRQNLSRCVHRFQTLN